MKSVNLDPLASTIKKQNQSGANSIVHSDSNKLASMIHPDSIKSRLQDPTPTKSAIGNQLQIADNAPRSNVYNEDLVMQSRITGGK